MLLQFSVCSLRTPKICGEVENICSGKMVGDGHRFDHDGVDASDIYIITIKILQLLDSSFVFTCFAQIWCVFFAAES